jgi:DNA-binding transcriptional regulator YdaS (Cro superfamily)
MVTERILSILSASELARRISAMPDPSTGRARRITPQAITKWAKHNRVPADRCIVVERVLDGQITRYEMRPDIFGVAETGC